MNYILSRKVLFRMLTPQEREQVLLLFPLFILLVVIISFLSPVRAHAQATSAFNQAAQTVEDALRNVSIASVAVLIVGGFFVFMWSGISDLVRRRALSILGAAIVGAIGVFLLATPLSQFLVSTFNTGGAA